MAAKNWLGLIFIILVIMAGVRFWVSPELKGPDIPKTEPQKVAISEAYLNLPPPGHSTTAAYLTIANLDQAPLTIAGFDSSKATRVELHEHIHADGMMKMRKVDQLTLSGMQAEVFKPMGYHLMIFGFASDVMAGQSVDFTAILASGERIVFQAEARGLQ